MTVDEIIAMLDAAESGNSIYDLRIARFVGWTNQIGYTDGGAKILAFAERHADAGRSEAVACHAEDMDLPSYTTSVDAALTLVPEDWRVWMSVGCGHADACLMRPEEKENIFGQRWWSSRGCPERMSAPTLPLAICIICLAARKP